MKFVAHVPVPQRINATTFPLAPFQVKIVVGIVHEAKQVSQNGTVPFVSSSLPWNLCGVRVTCYSQVTCQSSSCALLGSRVKLLNYLRSQ